MTIKSPNEKARKKAKADEVQKKPDDDEVRKKAEEDKARKKVLEDQIWKKTAEIIYNNGIFLKNKNSALQHMNPRVMKARAPAAGS